MSFKKDPNDRIIFIMQKMSVILHTVMAVTFFTNIALYFFIEFDTCFVMQVI